MRAKAERKSRPRSAALGLAGAPALQAVPPTAGASADAAIAALHEALAQARGRLDGDPYANPIALLALDLEQKLGSGVLDEHAAAALIQRLTREAFAERAAASRRYLGELDPARNRESIRQLLMGLARTADGAPQPFAVFAAAVERVYYGFVFTAHPTFGRTMELQTMLAAAAFGPDGDPQREQILARAERLTHRPPARLDLPEEHAQSIQVIRQVRAIVREVYEVAFDVARELYPDDWRKLRPRLLTLATWVGYDTDGRADIGWTITFAKRLMVQLDQLKHYRAVTQSCLERAGSEPLAGAAAGAARRAPGPRHQVGRGRSRGAGRARQAGCRLAQAVGQDRPRHGQEPRQPADRTPIRCSIWSTAPWRRSRTTRWRWSSASCAQSWRRKALVGAGTHVRINAIQLHNAIRKTIGMDHAPDDPTHRLTYVNAIAKLIDGTEAETINFASVTDERATARRMFMAVAQMLKHLDGSEPIRFLVAECDTSFTILTALYFARLFGVADRIDISPLFETRTALERGAEIIAGALAVPAYRDYLRGRGRICIQTGFSDAGRYMGQPAACALIEKIRLGMAEVLAAYGLTDLELTIFDTHGESIGRGAHPGSFSDRLRYYDTPESRRRFAKAGIALRQETSFQGGDGYLYFLAPQSALAVTTRILEHCLTPVGEADDPFYVQQDYVDEFFAAVEQFNKELIENPCYATLLGAYSVNMLYSTGSRSLKRQYDGSGARMALEHPSQLRAIPHNSILQQLGTLANTIGGVGEAVAKDPERFHALYRESPRFRRLVTMVEHAFKFTDLDVVKAYVDQFDPEPWLRRAAVAVEQTEQEELRLVADYLERIDLHDRLARIHRVFHRDYMDLARALREHRRMARDAGEQPIAIEPEARDNLHMLHALRLALIQRLMLLAVRVPDFSDRHATTHDTLIVRLMHLEVEPALDLLGQIFPVTEEEEEPLDFGEAATYRSAGGQSYLFEHQTIFRPIARDYDLIRRISSGVIYHVGAVG